MYAFLRFARLYRHFGGDLPERAADQSILEEVTASICPVLDKLS
jgi:hypothetical protein